MSRCLPEEASMAFHPRFPGRGAGALPRPRPPWLCLILDFVLLFFLAGWVVWWPDLAPDPEQGPRIDLPVVEGGWGWKEEWDGVRYVSITRDGRVYLDDRPLTLERLGAALREAMTAHDVEARRRGRTGFERVRAKKWVSKLIVALRVDRAAPWRAVHRMLRCVGERGLYQLRFLVARGDHMWNRLRVRLPVCLPLADREPAAYVRVRILRDPNGTVTYRVNDREQRDPAAVGEAIAQARETWAGDEAHRVLIGRIHPDPKAPFGCVAHALAALLDAGLERMDFLGPGDAGEGPVRAVAFDRPRETRR
ncbi:MAG: ExbD/TolR family protein [Planctomycetota bacterium]